MTFQLPQLNMRLTQYSNDLTIMNINKLLIKIISIHLNTHVISSANLSLILP